MRGLVQGRERVTTYCAVSIVTSLTPTTGFTVLAVKSIHHERKSLRPILSTELPRHNLQLNKLLNAPLLFSTQMKIESSRYCAYFTAPRIIYTLLIIVVLNSSYIWESSPPASDLEIPIHDLQRDINYALQNRVPTCQ